MILHDLGLSGYSGANAKRGALSALQDLLKAGQIAPGTILIVEAFDRLTRLPLPEAVSLLLGLIQGGLTVVTLTDGHTWSSITLTSLESFLLSVLTLYRGYQESAQKSERLRAVFQRHRDTNSQQAFGAAPGWLSRPDKFSPWVVDQQKADVVRRVFEFAAKGYGSKAIAKRANKEGWVVPTRLNFTEGRWHPQMPGQLLRDRAVLGEHEHRIHTHEAHEQSWRGLSAGPAIPDYYPRIVSDDLWSKAQASIETRRVSKRRDEHFFNIWSGLLYCGHCGAPIQRKSESRGHSKGTLVCSDKLAGLTDCPSMSVRAFDMPVIEAVYRASTMQGVRPDSARQAERAALEAEARSLDTQAQRLAEAVALTAAPVAALAARLSEVNGKLLAAREKIRVIDQQQLETDAAAVFDETYVQHAVSHLYKIDQASRDVRAELHLAMARLVNVVWLFAYELCIVDFRPVVHIGRQIVPLLSKRLPSRANPAAKYHKPPKPRPLKEPVSKRLRQALKGSLDLPEPRRRAVMHENAIYPELVDTGN